MTFEPSGPPPPPPPQRPPIRSGVLWAGGVATAVVAALVSAVGVVIAEGVLSIELLQVGLPGNPTAPIWLSYPVIAFLLAIAATGILHLLLAVVPQPLRFFNWIMGLITVLAAALPFVAGFSGRSIITSAVDFITALAVWLLLIGIAVRARRAPDGPRPA